MVTSSTFAPRSAPPARGGAGGPEPRRHEPHSTASSKNPEPRTQNREPRTRTRTPNAERRTPNAVLIARDSPRASAPSARSRHHARTEDAALHAEIFAGTE